MESVLGVMDGAVLERLARIMGYMRVAPGAKPGKRLKKRDKQRMLAGGTPIGTGGSLAGAGKHTSPPCTAPAAHVAVGNVCSSGPPCSCWAQSASWVDTEQACYVLKERAQISR